MPRHHTVIASVSLLALALAGCHKSSQDMSATSSNSGLPALPAALPMQTGPASQLTTAPPVSAIPVGRYVGISRPSNDREAYAYLDRASDIEDEVGDAPPDYEYDNDDGVSPWVWETRGGDYRYAEPTRDGYRYYYYQPGADYPYLVRAHDRSYAYAGGALVAIYALSGALLPPDQYGGYRDQASRYFSRGQQLRQSGQQRPHQGVVAANWAAQRPQFSAAQANWAAARAQQPNWQAYHAQNDPSQQPGWQQERQQRAAVAQQFSGWLSHGLAGAPPPVLAVVGARAGVPSAAQPVVVPSRARPAIAAQPGMPPPQGVTVPQGVAGLQRFTGPQGAPGDTRPHRRDMAGPQGVAAVAGPVARPMPAQVSNGGSQAAAAREQQLAAQRQALASQRLAQEASRAQQEAAAQRQAAATRQQQLAAHNEAQQEAARARQQAAAARQQAAAAAQQGVVAQQQDRASHRAEQEASRAREQAATQQQIANVHRQQDMAAQEQVLARQQVQQRDAVAAARVAQQQAAAAQRQAEQRQAAQSQNAARVQAPPPQAGPPPGHAEPSRPGQIHAPPGHEKDHNQQ